MQKALKHGSISFLCWVIVEALGSHQRAVGKSTDATDHKIWLWILKLAFKVLGSMSWSTFQESRFVQEYHGKGLKLLQTGSDLADNIYQTILESLSKPINKNKEEERDSMVLSDIKEMRQFCPNETTSPISLLNLDWPKTIFLLYRKIQASVATNWNNSRIGRWKAVVTAKLTNTCWRRKDLTLLAWIDLSYWWKKPSLPCANLLLALFWDPRVELPVAGTLEMDSMEDINLHLPETSMLH